MAEFTVTELADALGTTPTLVRGRLRTAGIPKVDGKYAWKNEKDFKAIVKQLSGGGKVEEKPTKSEKKSKETKNAGAAPENKSKKDKKASKKSK